MRWRLRAGARLIDMEFVQFFPIGHLAPRLIGMDPIMWDPFRYKLGGRLLNGRSEEFTSNATAPPRTANTCSRAISRPTRSSRRSRPAAARRMAAPILSFQHCSEAALRAAFGPVIDRLAANNIDLTKTRGRGRADRALSHGRHRGRRADAHGIARPVCRRRSGRRRQRRQPTLRQRHHRGAGVRPPRRAQRRRATREARSRIRAGRTPRRARSAGRRCAGARAPTPRR